MQKSENKIKPMYFWSDGYEEYGILRPDPKRIREEELVDVTDDNVPEYVFERKIVKRTKRSLKQFLRSKLDRLRQEARFYR